MPREKNQFDMRKRYNNTDRHGRMWLVSIEIDSGHPTGQIQNCFSAPLIPPQRYLSVPDEEPRTVRIDYDRWIEELKVQRRDFDMQRAEQRRRLAPDELHLLDDFMGPAPLDPRIVEMARDGDRALLGLEKEWSLKVSPEDYIDQHPGGPNYMLALVVLGRPLEMPEEVAARAS